ncbi:MAG: hypothetical protein HWN68_16505 [Desulfobacterales bacterium]|nr:hypothetical protein [Desulfobacterales bacterium]
MGIPQEGYGRRDAKRKLASFTQAFLDCMHDKRGSYKRKTEAGIWAAMMRLTREFADKYPLSAHQPMPMALAFEELVYKRPKHHVILKGYAYFKDADNPNLVLRVPVPQASELIAHGHEPIVLLEDGVTKAPQPIARLVKYRLRGDDNEIVKQIRIIFNRDSNWVEWKISSLNSAHTQ